MRLPAPHPSVAQMGQLRVATANLLHGMSLDDGTASEQALTAAIGSLDADVVALQEVDRRQERSGGVDQTELAAAALGALDWRFVPALLGTPDPARTWRPAPDGAMVGPGGAVVGPGGGRPADRDLIDGPSYGIGLASRLPVQRWAVRRFAASRASLPLLVPAQPRPRLMLIPDEPRSGLAAVVEGPSGPFTVVTAHLSFVPGTNVRQLRVLARWALQFPAPRLLLGDFNLPGSIPRRVTGWARLARVATYPSYGPRVQLDHVLGSNLGPEAVRAVTAPRLAVSDHCALVVDLDW